MPGSNDTLYSFRGCPRINNLGQVALVAKIDLSSSTGSGSGLFRGTGADGSLNTIARDGQHAPGGALGDKFANTFFANSSPYDTPFCLNNSGQLAFRAGIDTNNDRLPETYGIFFFDGTSLVQVARENTAADSVLGPSFAGGTITDLNLAGTYLALNRSSGVAPAERSGLNEAGQVAYWFRVKFPTTTQLTEGVAIWSSKLKLLCAVSRKTHGTAGKFDINLPSAATRLV